MTSISPTEVNLKVIGHCVYSAPMTARRIWVFVLVWLLGNAGLAESLIRRSATGEPQTLDPQLWTYGQDGNVAQDLFQGLTTLSADAEVAPGQAQAWTVSADGRTYTFKLRNNLQWSDGKRLTSDDFLWSFRRLFDPKTASPAVALLYAIKNAKPVSFGRLPVDQLGVSAPEPLTLVINLEHPAPYLLDLLVHRAFPVPRHVVERYGRAWTKPENIVSNGPFVFDQWRPGSHLRLVRNPRFHQADSVKLDAIHHVPVEDPKSAVIRYRAGELDIAVTLPSDQIDDLRRQFGDQLRLVRQLGLEYLAFNTQRGPTADRRVRQALSMTIDRELLVARVTRAGEPPAYCLVPRDVANYDDQDCNSFQTLSKAERTAQARELLRQAGFSAAKPLQLRLRVNNSETQRKLALAIMSMWQLIGVQTQLISTEMKSHQMALADGDFDVARAAWYAEDRDPLSFLRLLDARAPALNISRWTNRDYQQALDAADTTADLSVRARLLRQAEDLAMSDYPIAPIHIYVSRRLVAPRVNGWMNNARGLHLNRYLSIRAPDRLP